MTQLKIDWNPPSQASWLEGSLDLANRTAPQESGSEKMTNATYGQRCLEQFERFSHVGSWAKMFSALLIGMEGWYSKRCKLCFFQAADGIRYAQESRGLGDVYNSQIGSGLLLTPTSVMTDETPEKMRERVARNGYKNGTKYGSLLSQVKYGGMLPTPTSSAANGGGSAELAVIHISEPTRLLSISYAVCCLKKTKK